MFKAKTLKGKEMLSLSEGVPQGNILSPLLSNIYFSKLDEFVEHLIRKYDKGTEPTRNAEYYKAIYLTNEEKLGKSETQLSNLRKRKILSARKSGLYPTLHDSNYCRIRYVRYADDFIIGVRGTKEVALYIMKEVTNFLKSSLHLGINEEKTKLTHVYSDVAHFLGMRINCIPTSQVPFRRAAHIERFRRLQRRVKQKIAHAQAKHVKILQNELNKSIRNYIRKPNLAESLTDMISQNGLSEAIKDTNDRGIYRKLATELGQIEADSKTLELVPELGDLLTKLKNLVNSNLDPSKGQFPTKSKQVPITIKEITTRIYNKFGKVLELKEPPKGNLSVYHKKYFPADSKLEITKFPDDFELSPKQIEEIQANTKKTQSVMKYLLVAKILATNQDQWNEPTLIDSPISTGVRKRLEAPTGASVQIPTQIKADLDRIRKKLQGGNILNENGRYISKSSLLFAEDADIIRYYSSLAHGLLSYYRCVDNLSDIKTLVMHQIRFSLMATLRDKHKMSKYNFIQKYGDPISCEDYKGNKVSFLTNMQVYNLKKEFIKKVNPRPFENLDKVIVRLARSVINQKICQVKGCTNTDIEIHHIRQLFKRSAKGSGFTIISAGKSKRITGVMAIESALRRKQVALCKEHHND